MYTNSPQVNQSEKNEKRYQADVPQTIQMAKVEDQEVKGRIEWMLNNHSSVLLNISTYS